jgi:hypothetical protein
MLRWDGYVSLDAGEAGELLTKPLRFEGEKLLVNAAVKGRLRAELCDASGWALPGFRAEDCEPVTGDGVALPVRWRGGPALKPLAGKVVRVRFEMKDASLYSFRFA